MMKKYPDLVSYFEFPVKGQSRRLWNCKNRLEWTKDQVYASVLVKAYKRGSSFGFG